MPERAGGGSRRRGLERHAICWARLGAAAPCREAVRPERACRAPVVRLDPAHAHAALAVTHDRSISGGSIMA